MTTPVSGVRHNASALMERFDGLISANRQRPPDTTAPATALAHVQKEKMALLPLVEEPIDGETEARLYGSMSRTGEET